MTDETNAGTDVVRGVEGMPEAPPAAEVASVDDVAEALRDVVDPELGINVVDLGLVYDIRVEADNTATVDMTLTSAACPLTDVIEDQARAALTTGPGGGLVDDFRINWVWMPPWGPEKITEEGREQLRALGKAAHMSNVELRVVPFAVGAHTGMDGPFLLLEFERDKPLVHVEQRRCGAFLDDAEDVAPFQRARSSLCRAAMDPDRSAELVAAYAEAYEREEAVGRGSSPLAQVELQR